MAEKSISKDSWAYDCLKGRQPEIYFLNFLNGQGKKF